MEMEWDETYLVKKRTSYLAQITLFEIEFPSIRVFLSGASWGVKK